ncbi:MAG TPA: CheR family methyltransferase [Vicinamibacterales bacterium]|nr:CheR family methyltransferase [Vicinamibacterales bacterium]
MTIGGDSLGLLRGAVGLLRDLIHDRTGLFYAEERVDQMADRLSPLVTNRGFDSFLDYYYFLKYDETAAEEWDRVMDALAIPETYFWREVDQLEALVNQVIPSLARELTRPIRVWCVPCASGEEPLTLAMMLDQQGWRHPVAIEASDASPAALSLAADGLYRERSFRSLPPELRERYFTQEGARWRIDPALTRRIAWSRVNLGDLTEVMRRGFADIILCRNLFIYFSESAIRRVVDGFARATPTPAYLCVGAAESLLRVTNDFELEQIEDAFMYVKRHKIEKDVV